MKERDQRAHQQPEKKFGSDFAFSQPTQHWLDKHEAERECQDEMLRKRMEEDRG